MRIATWEGIKTMKVQDAPEHEIGPNDIGFDITGCGICGSDVHGFVEGAWIEAGQGMGHEFAGIVTQIGENVEGLKIGDRVALYASLACGECTRCVAGDASLCANRSFSGPGFAERGRLAEAQVGVNVFPLPEDIGLEDATLLEPLSVATRAVRQLDPNLDEPILVTGLGTIGQCVVSVLSAIGAKNIVAVDTSALRRETALKAGATMVVDPINEDVVTVLLDKFGRTTSPYRPESGSFGSAFECSGAGVVFDQTFKLLRAAGKMSLVGLTSVSPTIETNWIVQKELKVQGSFAYSNEDVQEAFGFIADKKVNMRNLITHTFDLEDIQEAFEVQTDSNSTVKVVVSPGYNKR